MFGNNNKMDENCLIKGLDSFMHIQFIKKECAASKIVSYRIKNIWESSGERGIREVLFISGDIGNWLSKWKPAWCNKGLIYQICHVNYLCDMLMVGWCLERDTKPVCYIDNVILLFSFKCLHVHAVIIQYYVSIEVIIN